MGRMVLSGKASGALSHPRRVWLVSLCWRKGYEAVDDQLRISVFKDCAPSVHGTRYLHTGEGVLERYPELKSEMVQQQVGN